MNLEQVAKSLVLVGTIIVLIGGLLYFARYLPFLGRLPGDIRIERPGFRLYAPLTTSILISLLLSAILYLISRRG